ncbi:Ubiquitin-like-conjugating enzyme ATG10 [Yarrowia sp. B02]|nr:Ubiquitin-like-conjugating enzyme ATG10 [Yarrowia sp. B02]
MDGFRKLAWPDESHVRWRDQTLSITRHGPTNQTAKYDILWSALYSCPVVYMACYRDSEPVTLLDEFVAFMGQLNVSITPDIGITQAEHPETGLPVFFLHPCKTREMLDLLQEGLDGEMAELWMETYGRLVGLEYLRVES